MTAVGERLLTGDPAPGFTTTEAVEASGAEWVLTYRATWSFSAQELAFPWDVFSLAFVPAMVAAMALFFVGRSRVRALLLAERLARDLAVSEGRARAVMDAAVEAIVTTDAHGLIETVNPAAEVLLGWPAPELTGRSLALVLPALELGSGQDLADIEWGPTEKLLNAHRRDGSIVHVDVSLAPASVEDRALYIVIARDATLRKLHEDQLTHQATHDPLTGLANRQLFDELLVRAVFRSDRHRNPVAVLYVDLDGFKEVNDAFGHQAGDRVLAEASRRLEGVVRPGDVVARLGGDEFAVLCENLQHVADAEKIAGRIVDAVSRPVPVASGVAEVTASVGVAIAESGEGASSVLSRADRAMYEAKRAGKCGWAVADPVGV
jgi:diguanylate cyclase (GGDEF)-like protein/PAS domain S-box-containing protein